MQYESAQELFDALCEAFPVEMIDWRVGPTNEKWRKDGEPLKGQPLCYVDARAVMDRLDSVCGPENWQCNYSAGVSGSIICNLGIRMTSPEGWIWKADGAGATDMEGEKGALSDAFKRAAVRFGIGRYLYDLKAPKIVLEQRGKSGVIPDAELKKLNDLHEDFAQKAGWGLRAGVQAYKVLNNALKEWVTTAADAQTFKDRHKSMIVQLPVGMRKHLLETLDRVGAQREAAE